MKLHISSSLLLELPLLDSQKKSSYKPSVYSVFIIQIFHSCPLIWKVLSQSPKSIDSLIFKFNMPDSVNMLFSILFRYILAGFLLWGWGEREVGRVTQSQCSLPGKNKKNIY